MKKGERKLTSLNFLAETQVKWVELGLFEGLDLLELDIIDIQKAQRTRTKSNERTWPAKTITVAAKVGAISRLLKAHT